MVGDAFNIALGFILLVIGTWVLIFGGIGLMLARSFGQNLVLGFALGTVLGPIGWLVIWLVSRRHGIARSTTGFVDKINRSVDLPAVGASERVTDSDDPWADSTLDDPLDLDREGGSRGF